MVPRTPNDNLLEPPWQPRTTARDQSPSKSLAQQSTQSQEADDERSSSFSSLPSMGPGRRRPRYEGEDARLTSKRELSGFYMYGWAAEVFGAVPLRRVVGAGPC